MASKLSFKSKTSTRLYLNHYRPVMNTLSPTDILNIPDEFTQYLNNTFYTEHIGIGTEEVIIMELSFKSEVEARKADRLHLASSRLLSVYLKFIGRHIGAPTKIKVIFGVFITQSDLAVICFVFVICSVVVAMFGLMHDVESVTANSIWKLSLK